METMKSKKEYRMNVRNLVYAPVLSDTEEKTEYGQVKKFASARQIQIAPTIAQGDLYGDGVKEKSMSKITGYDVQVDVNKVPLEVRADILGHEIDDNGLLWIGENDQPKEIALGYEVEQTGETSELVWLLKGTAQPFGNTVQQTETNINYSTDSLKITFVKRRSDGQFQALGDTAYEGLLEATAKTFFAAPPAKVKKVEDEG